MLFEHFSKEKHKLVSCKDNFQRMIVSGGNVMFILNSCVLLVLLKPKTLLKSATVSLNVLKLSEINKRTSFVLDFRLTDKLEA